MTMPPRRDDPADAPADPERDAWLSAALRQAVYGPATMATM